LVRLVHFLFIPIYLSIALKGAVHLHYCGNELASVSIFGMNPYTCACDEGENKRHCCHDEAFALDMDSLDPDENDSSNDTDNKEHLLFPSQNRMVVLQKDGFPKQEKILVYRTSNKSFLPKYIQYCSYLI
jgi:hypothetical protein